MTVTSRHDHDDVLLTASEVVEAFPEADFTAQTLRRWAREGWVACVRYPSGRLKFRRRDIEALLAPSAGASAASATSAPSAGSPSSAGGVLPMSLGQPTLAWPEPRSGS